jgi:GNAT superfamily N-acetyltransferase
MKIVEYNEVDPLQVVHLNQLALNFVLTPEMAAHIRRSDPRPFPCLAIYAVEEEAVLGQVGIYRLPMISTEGREEVGGLWAFATHPQSSGRGVAAALIEEAHARMREAGLRFSVLGVRRYCMAHKLFCHHGYEETNVWATALARWDTAHQPTRLHARPAAAEGYAFVEEVFKNISEGYLGFAWRHTPFEPLRRTNLGDIWILRANSRVVGYAVARSDETMLRVDNLALRQEIDAAEAIAAVAAELKSAYVQVEASRPAEINSLERAGYRVARRTWSSFMIKSLVPDFSAEEACRLLGIGTDRFLISPLDVS